MLDENDSAGVYADSYNSSVSHQPGPAGIKPIAYAPEAVAIGKLGMCTPKLRDLKDRLEGRCR